MALAPWGGTQEGRRGSGQGSLAYTDGLCPVGPRGARVWKGAQGVGSRLRRVGQGCRDSESEPRM